MKASNLRSVIAFTISGLAVSAAAQDCVIMNRLGTPTGGSQLAYKLRLDGDLAILADGANGMRIFDVSDVSNPVLLSATTNPGGSRDVVVSGTTAYLAANNDLRIFDIADPTSPTLIGLYETGSALAVALSGNALYTVYGSGFRVLDVSDPTNPVAVTSFSGGIPRTFLLRNDRLYVGGSEFSIYDISDPFSPVLLGSYDNPGGIKEIAIQDNLAYIACEIHGLRILDISDPLIITEIGVYNPHPDILSVTVSDSYAYAGTWSAFYTLDISVPNEPILKGTYTSGWSGGAYNSIAIRDGLLYSLSEYRGLEFLVPNYSCDDCLADINGNGRMDGQDFTAWIASFNTGAPACDQNGDRECTPADFTAWISNYNAGCP